MSAVSYQPLAVNFRISSRLFWWLIRQILGSLRGGPLGANDPKDTLSASTQQTAPQAHFPLPARGEGCRGGVW
jgi:hypothetical protein